MRLLKEFGKFYRRIIYIYFNYSQIHVKPKSNIVSVKHEAMLFPTSVYSHRNEA